MTGEANKAESIKFSAGLLWSASRNSGQAVLLRQGPRGVEYLGSQVLSGTQRPSEWIRRVGRIDPSAQMRVSMQAGLDSSQVGFYVFDVPAVTEPQLTSIVRTQAEGYLPLPVSAMRLAWRVDPGQPVNHCVLAAVRREVYEQTLARCTGEGAVSVVPDAAGLIACWHACFESSRHRAVVLSVGDGQAVAVLTEQGRILNAVRVDVDPEAPARLLVGDLLQSLASLSADIRNTEIFLLSGGSNRFPDLAEELEKEGFHVHGSGLDREKVRWIQQSDSRVMEACPEVFGLALLGLDGRTADLDFTVERTEPALTMRQQMLSAPVLQGILWILLAAAVCVVGLYWKDKMELRALERHLSASEEGQTARQLLALMEYRRQVAQARPDLLDLLDILRQVQPEGLLLDQFTFERGKPVELRGIAASYEQAYEFQKNLQQRSEVRQVQLLEPTLDEKTKKVNFRIRFAYRNFSG